MSLWAWSVNLKASWWQTLLVACWSPCTTCSMLESLFNRDCFLNFEKCYSWGSWVINYDLNPVPTRIVTKNNFYHHCTCRCSPSFKLWEELCKRASNWWSCSTYCIQNTKFVTPPVIDNVTSFRWMSESNKTSKRIESLDNKVKWWRKVGW